MERLSGADDDKNKRSVESEKPLLENEFDVSEWKRGWRPYGVLISGFLMMADCWGLVTSFGGFLGQYQNHLMKDVPDIRLGLLEGMEVFLVLFASLFVGRLLDAGCHYAVGLAGFVFVTGGYIALSFANHGGGANQGIYPAVFSATLVYSLGQGCFFIYSSQNASQWFPKRKFLVVGITSAGAAFGGFFYPYLLKLLIAGYGFPVAVRLFSIAVGVSSFIAFVLGRPPRGMIKRPIEKKLNFRTWIDTNAFRNPAFLWYNGALWSIFIGFYALPAFVTLWAQEKHLGTSEDYEGGTGEIPGDSGFRQFWFLSIMNMSSLLGRVISAFAVRYVNPMLIYAGCCCIASLVASVWWPLTKSTAGAIALCVFYGVAGGGIVSLMASCLTVIVPKDQEELLGQWVGMAFGGCAPFALVGSVIGGVLFSTFGANSVGYYTGSALATAAFCLLMTWRAQLRADREIQPCKDGLRVETGLHKHPSEEKELRHDSSSTILTTTQGTPR